MTSLGAHGLGMAFLFKVPSSFPVGCIPAKGGTSEVRVGFGNCSLAFTGLGLGVRGLGLGCKVFRAQQNSRIRALGLKFVVKFE